MREKRYIDRRISFSKIVQVVFTIVIVILLAMFLKYAISSQKTSQEALFEESISQIQEKINIQKEAEARYELVINEVGILDGQLIVELYNPTDYEIAIEDYHVVINQSIAVIQEISATIKSKGYNMATLALTELAPDLSTNQYSVKLLLDQTLIDSVYVKNISETLSIGRYDNNQENMAYMEPTFSQPNALATSRLNEETQHSHPSGFYSGDIDVSILYDGDGDVYYTLDGSIPTVRSFKYEQPIQVGDATYNVNNYSNRIDISIYKVAPPRERVDKATILRSATVDKDGNVGDVTTSVYFVGYDNKSLYQDMPIISLTLDPEDLFGYWDGIYVLGRAYDDYLLETLDNIESDQLEMIPKANYAMGIKQQASIQVIEADGSLSYEEQVSISIEKESILDIAQKSFLLEGISSVGMTKGFLSEVLGSTASTELIISNGFNDSLTMSRNRMINDLLSKKDVSARKSDLCIVFLNGEFWGIYSVYEPISKSFIAKKNGVDEQGISILNDMIYWDEEALQLKYSYDSLLIHGNSDSDYLSLISYITNNDISQDQIYEYVKSKIDMNSYIQTYAAMIYIADSSWLNQGQLIWRDDLGDGKWHWILPDVSESSSIGIYSDYKINSYNRPALKNNFLFNQLCQNDDFVSAFVTELQKLSNVTLSAEHVNQWMESESVPYQQIINKTYDRFMAGIGSDLSSQAMKQISEFYRSRSEYLSVYTREKFNIQEEILALNIKNSDVSKGMITLDNEDIIVNQETSIWKGHFYEGTSLTFIAYPYDGNNFVGWTDSTGEFITNEAMLKIEDMASDMTYTAVFESN